MFVRRPAVTFHPLYPHIRYRLKIQVVAHKIQVVAHKIYRLWHIRYTQLWNIRYTVVAHKIYRL